MSEKEKQELSALVDGELDGAETERLLDTLGSDAQLRDAWSRYQLIGTALRRGLPARIDPRLGESIGAAIADRLPDGDVTPLRSVRPRAAPGRWRRPVVGLALAASVAALAIVGLRTLQAPSVAPLPVASLATTPVPADIQPVTSRLDQQKLARYMIRHNEFASARTMQGVLPYVRVVSQDDSPAPVQR